MRITNRKNAVSLSVLTLALVGALAAVPAFADNVLYDNTTSSSFGNSPDWNQSTNGTTDSFVLSSSSTITGLTLGLWVDPGYTPTSVTWQMTSNPFDFSDPALAAGTATGLTNTFETTFTDQGFSQDIYDSAFSISALPLPGGTYWLEIDGVSTTESGGNSPGWDESVGPSTAYNLDAGPISSETFQILGTSETAETPEPSSFLLLGSGLLGLAGFVKHKLKA